MSRNFAVEPFNAIRRSDRAIEDETWIRAMLHRLPVGTLATVFEGQPFINTNLFVYDESAHILYMHTARLGRTQANISQDERMCFAIHEMGRLLPASTALEFSVEYASVVVFGRAQIVTDHTQARYALQLLLEKYFPHLKYGEDYRPIRDEELARTAVYALKIDSWSAKKKEVTPDFPDAFRYPHRSVSEK